MLKIGKINTLTVVNRVGSEIYLGTPTSAKILLIDKKKATYAVGDTLDVFVFIDMDGHLTATTITPKAQVDDIAWLQVVSINRVGVFMDWGLPKDLLVPFGEQHHDLEVGESYLVKLFLDSRNRILATTKIDQFIAEENVSFNVAEKVSLVIADKTDLGFKAIINNTHWGMLYENELFETVKKGQKIAGYIKNIREDRKIDLSLYLSGYKMVDPLIKDILAQLKDNQGYLPFGDKSKPEEIHNAFGVSKKVFKQAIGTLYKQKIILLEKEGIRLI